MTNTAPEEEYTEETGLNLFDDRASAAGSFPHAMLGYDRPTVDSYVRDIEQQVATLRQLTRHLRSELANAQRTYGDSDFTRLGSHATGILRAAESQASDLISRAASEAERIKEEGRRVATDLRAGAQTEADDIRVETLANLRAMREKLDVEATDLRAATQSDCAAMLEAARTQAQAILDEARHNTALAAEQAAALVRQQAEEASRDAESVRADAHGAASKQLTDTRVEADRLLADARTETEKLLTAAQADAAQTRANAHDEAQRLLAGANAEAATVAQRVAAMLADATAKHAESVNQVTEATSNASRIRLEALEAAEQLRNHAAQEAETQVAASHRQSAMMKDRLEEQYAWRKEQLERDIAALLQRKAAIVTQLGNLRQLAEESTSVYPDTASPEQTTLRTEPSMTTSDTSTNDQWLAQSLIPPAARSNEPTAVLRRGEGPTQPSASQHNPGPAEPATSTAPTSSAAPQAGEDAEPTTVIEAETEPTKVIKLQP